MKCFQIEGRFPGTKNDIPRTALQYLAEQLNVSTNTCDNYSQKGRSAKRDRESIRTRLGFRPVTVEDSKTLVEWLRTDVLPRDHKQEHIREAALEWCRRQKIEPPAALLLKRIVNSALNAFEKDFFLTTYKSIPHLCQTLMDALAKNPDDADLGQIVDPNIGPIAGQRSRNVVYSLWLLKRSQ